MFLLSIIPMHLIRDMDGQGPDRTNSVDVMEHRVMELEALYTSLILNQYLGYQVEGVSNYNLSSISSQLQSAREQEIALREETGETSHNDSKLRSVYLNYMTNVVDTRVNDLNGLKDSLQSGEQPAQIVSGVDNTNIYKVNLELHRALLFKQEVQTSVDFWNQISSMQDKALLGEVEESEEETSTEEVELKETPAYKPKYREDLAVTKKRLGELKSMLSLTSSGKDIDQLKFDEGRIKSEIASILSKLGNVKNKNEKPQDGSKESRIFSGLNTDLKANLSEQQITKLLSQSNAQIQSEITALMKNL